MELVKKLERNLNLVGRSLPKLKKCGTFKNLPITQKNFCNFPLKIPRAE